MSESCPTLEGKTVKQLQSLLRQNKLPVSGRKNDLIERLKKSIGRSANINESSDGEKRTGDVASLKKLTVEQLKTLLRQKGLPVSGGYWYPLLQNTNRQREEQVVFRDEGIDSFDQQAL